MLLNGAALVPCVPPLPPRREGRLLYIGSHRLKRLRLTLPRIQRVMTRLVCLGLIDLLLQISATHADAGHLMHADRVVDVGDNH